jgi:hypothetical protein
MKLICWNCRGLGNPRTVKDLCQMVKVKRPGLVFLMETKLRSNKMVEIKHKAGFTNVFVVDCVGRSGGLALMWGEDVDLEIINYNRKHIHANIISHELGTPWKFTGFYGHLVPHKRHEAWSLLRYLKSLSPLPWVCAGDFNEILDLSVKVRGAGRSNQLMAPFKDTLVFCDLKEVELRGPFFTWDNGRDGADFTKERLDRVVTNREWRVLFPKVEVASEMVLSSDHTVTIVATKGLSDGLNQRRIFRYEAGWSEMKACKKIIKQVWQKKVTAPGTWVGLRSKMESSKKELQKWSKGNVRPNKVLIVEKTRQLSALQDEKEVMDVGLHVSLKKEIVDLQKQEEVYWGQRAKES